MIDLIKYFPLRLRIPDDNEGAKGPNLRWAREFTLTAAGNTIRFRAPWHRPGLSYKAFNFRRWDVTEGGFRGDGMQGDTWVSIGMFARGWTFWHAWFGGRAADTLFHIAVVKRADKHAFESVSFLNPQGFEYAISNYLNTEYGVKANSRGEALYQAPVNWRRRGHLPVFSASFDLEPGNESLFFVFPISHRHFIELNFSYMGAYGPARVAMAELANQIIESLSLELGPETQAQWDQAQAALREQGLDTDLSEDFAPLKWPIKKEAIESVPTVNLEPPPPSFFDF